MWFVGENLNKVRMPIQPYLCENYVKLHCWAAISRKKIEKQWFLVVRENWKAACWLVSWFDEIFSTEDKRLNISSALLKLSHDFFFICICTKIPSLQGIHDHENAEKYVPWLVLNFSQCGKILKTAITQKNFVKSTL